MNLLIRLIPHRQIKPSLFIHNTFFMGECPESILPMVRSHTALSEPAEAHLAGSEVNNRIIDASAAEPAPGGHFPYGLPVVRKNIEGQRMSHGLDIADCLVQSIEGQDGHQRPEYFFLHHCG